MSRKGNEHAPGHRMMMKPLLSHLLRWRPLPCPPCRPTLRALYHCNYCQKDISNVPRIKCAICLDFDLCLECFSVGVEVTPHKNWHDYRVVDNLSFPIFHPEWGVRTWGGVGAARTIIIIYNLFI